MQNIRFTIAAGETKRFELIGRYLEIIDAIAPLTIRLSGRDGGTNDVAKDVLSGTYMGTPFTGFEVTSATAQTVELFVTETSGGTKRQPGTVRVVDQGAELTAAGSQFLGTVLTGASASGFSLAGIACVSRRVLVKKITVVSPTAGIVTLYRCTGAPTFGASNYTPALQNKNLGGTGSTAQALRGLSAASTPTAGELPGVAAIAQVQVAANTPEEIPLTTPIRLGAAGVGLVLQGVAINSQALVYFDAEESDV